MPKPRIALRAPPPIMQPLVIDPSALRCYQQILRNEKGQQRGLTATFRHRDILSILRIP